MIKLSDVSTERLITFLEYNSTIENKSAIFTLRKHGIKDFQSLKNMVDKGKKKFRNPIFKTVISKVESNIIYANNMGRKPTIFLCNNYANSNVSSRILKYTDDHNTCDVLICKSPAILCSGKFGSLKNITVSEAKDLLTKVTCHDKSSAGNNAFVEKFRRFRNSEAECVRDAINFYEEQVLRQAIETKKRKINLFELNNEEKKIIVTQQIENIVKYLIDATDIWIWGELTPTQKKTLISAVTSYNGYQNQIIRERIIETIANYTTLDELKSDVVKQKTLDRFIVK